MKKTSKISISIALALALIQSTTQFSSPKFTPIDDFEGLYTLSNATKKNIEKYRNFRLQPKDYISTVSSAPNNSSEQLKPSPYFPYDPIRGYIQIYPEDQGGDNSLWYWLFKATNNPETAPLIIWFSGGPGGASSTAAFGFMGPFEFKNWPEGGKKAVYRNYYWNENANVLFIDFPLGTGFSTVTQSHVALGGKQIEEQILIFYTKFLEKFPEYKKRELYITGSSFGGHWVPYAATALKYSQNADINVTGFLIDSGIMNATTMFSSYVGFARRASMFTGMTSEQANFLEKFEGLCSHYTIF